MYIPQIKSDKVDCHTGDRLWSCPENKNNAQFLQNITNQEFIILT